jgi:hypothetical protein
MTRYRILNTEPDQFFAQWRHCLRWEVLKPFTGFDNYFYTEAAARNRIEVDIHQGVEADAIRAARKALLKGFPKIIAYVRDTVS